jgi:excisionase family DNA binding protein
MVTLLTVEKAAQQLNISIRRLRSWMGRKEIEYVRMGKTPMIKQSTIDDLVASRTVHTVDLNKPIRSQRPFQKKIVA